MHAQNCLFLALECSNRAHSDLDKLMEALFIIRGGGLACSRRARHGALAGRRIAGASFGTLTGRRRGRLVGTDSAGRAPFSLAAGAGAADAGGAGEVLLKSSTLMTRLRRAGPNEAQVLPPSPRCRYRSSPLSPSFWENCCEISLR